MKIVLQNEDLRNEDFNVGMVVQILAVNRSKGYILIETDDRNFIGEPGHSHETLPDKLYEK